MFFLLLLLIEPSVRQAFNWIKSERHTDLVFESLHRCEDADVAGEAVEGICAALCNPYVSLSSWSSSSSSSPRSGIPSASSAGIPTSSPSSGIPSYAGTETTNGGADVGTYGLTLPPQPSQPPGPVLSLTTIYSRIFSLFDDLNCWRSMSPQLQRLVSLNPSVFAGAIIGRAAISPPCAIGGEKGEELSLIHI